MNLKSKKNMSFIFAVYMLLLIASVILIIIARYEYRKPDLNGSFSDYNFGWVNVRTNEAVDLTSPLTNNISVCKTLENLDNNQVIFMRAKNVNIDVFIGGLLRRSSDADYNITYKSYYKTPGTYFITIPVSSEDNGKQIEIAIECPYANDKSCNVKTMYIGDGEAILKSETAKALVPFTECVIIVALGLLFIITSIPLRKYESGGNNLLYLGLFAVTLGVWATIETRFLTYIYDDSVFLHFIPGITLMLVIVPLFIFFKLRHSEFGTLSVYIVGGLSIVVYIISIFWYFTRRRDLHESLFLTHICLFVGVIFTLYYAFKIFVSSRFKDMAFIGLVSIAVCAGLDLVFYYFQIFTDNSTLTRIGVAVYIAILGYQIITVYIKNYNTMVRVELLHKLAFTDILTELGNRNAFSEEIKSITGSEQSRGRVIAVMDMNNLKEINDTLGHSYGDKAILESSDIIRDVFSGSGVCYRIGGDEFVFISGGPMTDDAVRKLHNRFSKQLEQRNKANNLKYRLYIAFGFAVIGNDLDPDAVFKAADEKMYADKKFIKDTYGVGR